MQDQLDSSTTAAFERVFESDKPAPAADSLRFGSFQELIFGPASDEESTRPIFAGEVDGTKRSLSLEELRRVCEHVASWSTNQGFEPGDTVALVRLEGASELPLAATAVAMMAAGLRVFLPMGFDGAHLPEMLGRTDAKAVFSFADRRPDEGQRQSRDQLNALCGDLSLPHVCLRRDVDVFGQGTREAGPKAPTAGQEATRPEREVCVFTTTGSTGAPKLVPYTERALLTGAQAWEDAGLLTDERLGGSTVVPLLSHTMGFRHVLHALWKRRCALFVRPEWLEARPYRVVSQLLKFAPAHVTCGPALLGAYSEYMRMFPVLREKLEPNLRCIVSSGTAHSAGTSELFSETEFANAFGTTETQQVLNTLVQASDGQAGDVQAGDLGRPLPGVRVAVDRDGRLFVSSPFGGAGYIDSDGRTSPFEEWHDTGDLVSVDGESLTYVARAGDDFFNTGVGVKVARGPIEAAYADLVPEVHALLIDAPSGRDGLVALAFVDGAPEDPGLQERIAEAAAARRQQLGADGHDLDFGRVPVAAIGLVAGRPPLRGPGKLDRERAKSTNAELMAALADPTAKHPCVVSVPEDPTSRKRRYLYPRLGRLIEALRLDVDYVSGGGNRLVRSGPDGPVEVLDMTGGYGANLLGHGREELRQVAVEALGGVPLLDQVSGRSETDRFAEKLALRVGRETGRRWIVLPASTGAEAVEMALKHAAAARTARIESFHRRQRQQFGAAHPELVEGTIAHNLAELEARRPVVVGLRSGFHGKTIGALHLLGKENERRAFSPFLAADTVFLDPKGGPDAREQLAEVVERETMRFRQVVRDEQTGEVRVAEKTFSNILATVAEPIQGEGGIIEVPHGWLRELKVDGVPFIVDEIQSGLGRSGGFLASTDPETGQAAPADCILLGKSLGGGVAKLSALLVERSHYLEAFDEWRGSTFAEDSFSSAVGSEVLDIIERDDVPRLAQQAGERLISRLQELQETYPEVIADIRGRGVMVGVELRYPNDPPSTMLRSFARRGLGYMAASYLLHRHDLRIFPTSSAPSVLRLEPSAYLTGEEIAQVAVGLEELCQALRTSNAFELLSHIVDGSPEDIEHKRQIARATAGTEATAPRWIERHEPAEGARRVAFIHHPMHPSKEMMADAPVTGLFTTEQRLELADLLQVAAEFEPIVSFSRNFFDGEIWMAGITVMATPLMMEYMYRTGDVDLINQKLQKAVELAAEMGCEALTFGGFTSIVSEDATLLTPVGDTELSSGNTFTAAVTLHQIHETCAQHGFELGEESSMSVAVVGALGNIGRALAELLAVHELPRAQVTLFGRAGSDDRLEVLREEIVGARQARRVEGARPINCSTDLDDVREADLVVVAVNTAEPILFARHIGEKRPVIIADVSQPRATSDEVAKERPQSRFLESGMVRLPKDRDFLLSPYTPSGTLFACAAEALLMGLSEVDMELTGEIRAENIRRLFELGEELGLFQELVMVD